MGYKKLIIKAQPTDLLMANCIIRIFEADCLEENKRIRAYDIVHVINLANTGEISNAHYNLTCLVQNAEGGKYTV